MNEHDYLMSVSGSLSVQAAALREQADAIDEQAKLYREKAAELETQ